MKIKILDEGSKIAIVDMEHATGVGDIRRADEALIDLYSQEGPFDVVYDCSNSDFQNLESNQLMVHAFWLASRLEHFPKHIALVAARDMEFAICRMWEMQAETLAPADRRVFREMESALEWLQSLKKPELLKAG